MSRYPVDVGELAAHWVAQQPDQVAVTHGARCWTWSELAERVASASAALRLLGLRPGDRVAVLTGNHPATLELTLACARLGTVCVPVNPRLPAEEIEYLVNDSTATLLVIGPESADADAPADSTDSPGSAGQSRFPAVRHVIRVGGTDGGTDPGTDPGTRGCSNGRTSGGPADGYEAWLESGRAAAPGEHSADPDACFLQLYTSGTTGRPKGVLLTHRGVLGVCAGVQPISGGRPDHSWLVTMPLSHIGGQECALAALCMGARVVLARDGEPDVAGLIERERITHTFLPAATLAALSADAGATTRDFGAVRQVWFGGCTIPRSTLRDCMSLFPDALVHAYGMTEVCGVATVLGTGERLDHRHRLSSVGRPIAGVELQVRDPNTGAPLPSGRPGEVWVRTAHLMAGYWRDPEATEAAITEGGWYRTGDGGLLDAHGYLYLTDRIQDRIISGGRYVYPSEVERILAELPSVAELAVIGVPDESWGEVPKALVVAAEGHTVDEAALLAHCRRYLAKEKCPRSVDVVDHLPRNATGRITKKDLYPRYWPHPD